MSVTAEPPFTYRPPRHHASAAHFLAGGGEMGERMRRLDWAATSLGAPEGWPQSLKTIVRVMLDSRYAMWMLWGSDMTFFCNDAYLPTVGIKREWVLGARADKVWEEIWPDIGPRIKQVLTRGEATWDEGLRLYLERSGFPEETYHTFSYSPVYDDDSRIAGMLCVVTEVTQRVIGERQLKLLRDLGIRAITMQSVEGTCRRACEVLAQYPLDIAFAGLYLVRPGTEQAQRVARSRVVPERILPAVLDPRSDRTQWPLAQLWRSAQVQQLSDLPWHGMEVAAGPWPDPVQQALLLPLVGIGPSQLSGVIIIGVSPRRVLDDSYRSFLELIAGQVAAALADAQAYEAERRRAEALAEIDRAKTMFFSNISHEFRTPLTLLLGPLADAIDADYQALPRHIEGLRIAYRNARRLLKLVNTLLDFSRIEVDRTQANYRLTDLGPLTGDLLSLFRAAVDKSGLRFSLQGEDSGIKAWIDREMWEKIVLNLVSNALKFTLEGEIAVTLRQDASEAVLQVRDTGIGIPAESLPHLFERFYRVPDAIGRSHEGSGIGLSLVAELVKLHGGTVRAHSEVGRGSTFEVRLPLGNEHLPAERLDRGDGDRSMAAAAEYVEEALHWRDGPAGKVDGSAAPVPAREKSLPRVMLVDDNAHMRDYITRLLAPHFTVVAVKDGIEALNSLERLRPELVLSDIMMPRLDGYGLLKAIRSDKKTQGLPVILLSARASEEAKVEGLEAGADDYLVKPFSSGELIARVASHVAMARLRRDATAALMESEQRFRVALDSSAVGFTIMTAVRNQRGQIQDFRWQYLNAAALRRINWSAESLVGRRVTEVFPRHWEIPGLFETLVRVVDSGEPGTFEVPLKLSGEELWFHNSVAKLEDGIVVWFADISERKRIEAQLREEDRKKDEFLAVLAHELRNPLAPIRQAAALARLPQVNDQQLQWSQQVIERQVKHMARLLDDLLDISRITRGRLELRKERIDIKSVIDAAVEAAKPIIADRRHAFEVILPEPIPMVDADPMRLSQVLSNLLANAAKYTDPGGRIVLRVESDLVANTLAVRVIDNGIGIPPGAIPGLFEMFSQLRTALDHAEGGLGIGLALVKGLMVLHGGSVEAHSEGAGRGSEFIVRMPLPSSGFDSIAPTVAIFPEKPAAKLRILVADDNRDAAESLSTLLRIEGHEVCTTFDGEQAIAAALRFRPRLMLVDIGMPGKNGYEVAARIRQQLADETVTLVAVTGWGQESDKQRALNAGFDRHLTKPVDYEALRGLLSSMVVSLAK